MSGARLLAILAVAASLLCGVDARAQDNSALSQDVDDEPMPPPIVQPIAVAPNVVACCVVQPERPHGRAFVKLSVGALYRRAFGDDLLAARPEIELGGETSRYAIGGRISAALGATRYGLPYQHVELGPHFMWRVSPRVQLGVGLDFGVFMFERVTEPGDVVWTLSLGGMVDATIDLARTRAGTLFLAGRVGVDYLLGAVDAGYVSFGPELALGWHL